MRQKKQTKLLKSNYPIVYILVVFMLYVRSQCGGELVTNSSPIKAQEVSAEASSIQNQPPAVQELETVEVVEKNWKRQKIQ